MANNKRPEDRRSVNVTIRFRADELARIDDEAEAQKTTRSEIVRQLVNDARLPHEQK